MTDKMKDLGIRTLSGLALLILVVGATLWSEWSIGVLLFVIVLGGVTEFYNLCRKCGLSPLYWLGIVAASITYLFGFFLFRFLRDSECSLLASILLVGGLLLLLLIPTTFTCELWRKKPNPIANIAATFTGILYVALPMSLLIYIPGLLVGHWDPVVLLCYIFIIWANDISAYLVGVCFGRHRMSSRISPKKSWEGFFGGVIATIAVSILCGYIFKSNLVIWGVLGGIVSITCVAGDFVESLFKRSAGVKDSGAILPGHGGFLDRFDAMLISTPYIFVYLLIWNLLV